MTSVYRIPPGVPAPDESFAAGPLAPDCRGRDHAGFLRQPGPARLPPGFAARTDRVVSEYSNAHPVRPPPDSNSSTARPDALAAGPRRCFRGDSVRGGGADCPSPDGD